MRQILLGCLLILTTPVLADSVDLSGAVDHLDFYLESVLSDDLLAARACWRPIDLAAAERLGITYTDQPLKIDGDSPIWRLREPLRSGQVRTHLEPPIHHSDGWFAGAVQIPVVLEQGSQEVRHNYWLVPSGESYLLVSPVQMVVEAGPRAEGRHITVYDRRVGPGELPAFQVALLDSCLESMADRCGIELPDDARLGYLLADPATVELLAGAPTVGVANLQTDVVVTHHPCHAHELAHLLAGLWLEELPLFTLPLLQEGLAVHLGGRWGRHPRVLDRLGRTSLGDGWVTLDDLMLRQGFYSMSADLTYPPAGVFVGYVLEEFGADGLRRAYRAASGTAAQVSDWNAVEVGVRLGGALGVSWEPLKARFGAWLAKPVDLLIMPGITPSPFSVFSNLQGSQLEVQIMPAGHDLFNFTIRADSGLASGALLIGGGGPPAGPHGLFAEHFGQRPYRGESHGLLFSPDEVKIYDYRLQMLTALHAEGFWPSDNLVSDEGMTLHFRVRNWLEYAEPWTVVEW